jgi:hypothetical protein
MGRALCETHHHGHAWLIGFAEGLSPSYELGRHRPEPVIGPDKGRTRWADPDGRNKRIFSWLLDCFALLAMTGWMQRA